MCGGGDDEIRRKERITVPISILFDTQLQSIRLKYEAQSYQLLDT